jgi:hypothetical protein
MRDSLKHTNSDSTFPSSSPLTCGSLEHSLALPVPQDPFIDKTSHMGKRSASHANGMDHRVQRLSFLESLFRTSANEKSNGANPFFDGNY